MRSRWLADIRARGKLPVVVGGTGLYVRALAEGLFRGAAARSRQAPLARCVDRAARAHRAAALGRSARPGFRGGGRQRAARAIEVALLSGHPLSYWQQAARAQGSLDPWYIVLTVPRPVLHQRIARRAEEMVRRGLIEEVAAVLAEGHAATRPGLDGIGIREAVEYLHGSATARDGRRGDHHRTRQYAKRQQTWFRHQLAGNVVMLDATVRRRSWPSEIAGCGSRAQRP